MCVLCIGNGPGVLWTARSYLSAGRIAVFQQAYAHRADLMSGHCSDAVLVEVGPSHSAGMDAIIKMRQAGIRTPLMALSQTPDPVSEECSLRAGADDFLAEPFGREKFLARFEALLRRRQPAEVGSESIVFGVFELNPNTRRLSSGKNSVALTPKQFGILHLLVQYVGRPLSREYIFSRMYDPAKDTDSRAVDVIVKKLRAKMQTLAEGNCIRTLHSAGYVVDPARMKKGGW